MGSVISIGVGLFLITLAYRIFKNINIKEFYKRIFSKFKWRMLPLGFLTLTLVLATSYLLLQLNEAFSLSWLNLFGKSGGNILVSGDTGSSSTNNRTSASISLSTLLISLFIPSLILLLIPFLAYNEEDAYRKGSENRSKLQKILKALQFGLLHMVVGVPLAIGLALSIGGLYFTYIYMKEFNKTKDINEAVNSSTAAHAVYNYIAVGSGIILLILFYFIG